MVIVLGQDSDRPVGGQAGHCVFEDLGGRVGLVKNIQGPAWPHLLSKFCAIFFYPTFRPRAINKLTPRQAAFIILGK